MTKIQDTATVSGRPGTPVVPAPLAQEEFMSSPPSEWCTAPAWTCLPLLALALGIVGLSSPVSAQQTAVSATFASSGSLFEGASVGLAHRSNGTVLSAGVTTTGISHAASAVAASHRHGSAHHSPAARSWSHSCWDLWDPWYGYPVGCSDYARWSFAYGAPGPWAQIHWWDPYYWVPVHHPVVPVRFTHRFRPRTSWSFTVHVGSGWGWYDPWWGPSWVAGSYWAPGWGPTYVYQPSIWVVRPPRVIQRPTDRWAYRPSAPAPRVGYMEDPSGSSAPATRRAVSPQTQGGGVSAGRTSAAPPPDLRTRRAVAGGNAQGTPTARGNPVQVLPGARTRPSGTTADAGGGTTDRLPTVIRGTGRTVPSGSDRVDTGAAGRTTGARGQRQGALPTTRPAVATGQPGTNVRTNPAAGARTGASARERSSDRTTPAVRLPARARDTGARSSGASGAATRSLPTTSRSVPTTSRRVPTTARPLPRTGASDRGAASSAGQRTRGVRPTTGGGSAASAGRSQVRPGTAASATGGVQQRGTARTGRAGGG